ncbi:heparinase II/III family protein [Beijerinckia indica]|uniref:Heparinase II/III family protein n=1 Tax=Beijerinckia indica subsp. indica (strain ATCC 9039 / DSM 1715 / NCIMB 8712) TaxID=395963 RepID=B2ILL3_BEII9|nr:heparinase II/III family protein [Beijerinckia indica]ACB97413.1 Heparinase II/III family protein [Beijerinckia indica subsp. indica ATCC 9039]
MVKSKLLKLRRTLVALHYVPLRRILLRGRREMRWRRLLKSPKVASAPALSAAQRTQIITLLTTPAFTKAARKIAELTASSFLYEADTDTLIFIASGDRVRIDDIDDVAWTKKGGIPASDVNRSFFMSFVEQATLVKGDPRTDLEQIDRYVARLVKAAPIAGTFLPIPWHSLTVARRAINLLAALSLLLERDPSLASHMAVTSLIEHIALLEQLIAYLREDDLGYNHLASEVFAQCLIAYAFGTDQRFERLIAEFLDVIDAQISADGMQLERSPTYQAHVLGHVDVLLAGNILPEAFAPRMRDIASRMREALAILTHPDGGIAVFNDAAVGDGPTPAALGAWPRVWSEGVVALPDAGYARLRGGDLVAIFDAGPCGPDDNPGHAHADFLSFELSLGDKRLFVDPGVASYKASPERDRCRSAASHNGPTFLGLEPIEFIGPFRVSRRGRAEFFTEASLPKIGAPVMAAGWQNGFDPFGGRVSRWLGLWPDSILTSVDLWTGRGDLEAVSTFLVPTIWHIQEKDSKRIVFGCEETGERVILRALKGTLAIGHTIKYFPTGPRCPEPAQEVVLHPDGPTSDKRVAALMIAKTDAAMDIGLDASALDRVISTLEATQPKRHG